MRKMCPFVTNMRIPVKKEMAILVNGDLPEDIGIGFPCIESACMAWVKAGPPLVMEDRYNPRTGYCKLIGEIK